MEHEKLARATFEYLGTMVVAQETAVIERSRKHAGEQSLSSEVSASSRVCLLTALRADPPFSWGVTSRGPPGGRSLSKDGTRADSAKYFCRLVGGVIRRK